MNKLTIGIADMKMARNEGVLITYALGRASASAFTILSFV